MVDNDTEYRIAVNVKSKLSPSELFYFIDDHFQHPITDGLEDLPIGVSPIQSNPGGIAVDYIRGNLFDWSKMTPLPFDVHGPNNDLNEKLDHVIQRALSDEDALVYAFGERWGPESARDKHFGFMPGNGIHDIHMNQGSEGQFKHTNGVWQDGGLFIQFPTENKWVATFLAFQSQCRHTDDTTGDCIGDLELSTDGDLRIVAALVNPPGHDPGSETVTIINISDKPVDLNGWKIADKNKRKTDVGDTNLAPGAVHLVRLSGGGAQLVNKGGIISLLKPNGIKADGVSYTKEQARKQGWTLTFRS